MFAVFKNGGKQYTVCENQVLKLEKIEAELGSEIVIDEVMMVEREDKKIIVGSPYIKGAAVTVQLVDHDRNEKVIIFKKRRRKNYRRKNGHRQPVSLVKVVSIAIAK